MIISLYMYFRDDIIAASVNDCTPCPAGRYCPDYNMTDNGYDCPNGSYCPEGSSDIKICSAGMYYGHPITVFCSYCPEGTSSVWISSVGIYVL